MNIIDVIKQHRAGIESREKQTGKQGLSIPFKDISDSINAAAELTRYLEQNHPFKPPPRGTAEQVTTEVVKRIYRDMLFVPAMSVIEYHLIGILTAQYPHLETSKGIIGKQSKKKEVHLGSILKDLPKDIPGASEEIGVLGFLKEVRNDIVHGNAITKLDLPCPYTDDPIKVEKDKMIAGTLIQLLSLTKHAENAFYEILTKLP